MELRTYTCPHCGAHLTIEMDREKAVCEYCDSVIFLEDGANAGKKANKEPEPEREAPDNEYAYGGQTGADTYRSQNYDTYGNSGYGAGSAASGVSPLSRTVALLICIFVGIFGGHRFYVGKFATGILYLLTFALFGFGWIYDMIMILTGSFRDCRGLYLKNW